MTAILLVKTSSLGDVIHNLPVVSDIMSHVPGAKIDWVVEEAFTSIPRLHPGVRKVLPVAIRRWRKSWLRGEHRREIREFIDRLRETTYDAIIDTQGLIKSAAITRLARGRRVGFDRDSVREPLAARGYRERLAVPRGLHAVERNRLLAASALGYTFEPAASYGITVRVGGALKQPFAVFLHATSRSDKEWPRANWIEVGSALSEKGIATLIPGGTDAERAVSQEIASAIPDAAALGATSLDELAVLLGQAEIVIGVDTGLTHLACALARPTIGIYAASDPFLTGLYGSDRAVNLGDPDTPATVQEVLATASKLLAA